MSAFSPPVGAAATATATNGSTWAAIRGMYGLLLRQQVTKGRLVLVAVLTGLSLLLAVLIARDGGPTQVEDTLIIVSVFGLGLVLPILALVQASSTFSQVLDDETLVYLWLRPLPRWTLALSGLAAAATVTIPATVIPLAAAAAVGSGGDVRATWATALAIALGAFAYSSVFLLAGLLVRRALIWGLLYIFIWEFFVARVGQGAARLSINTYPSSVLAKLTDIELPLADRLLGFGIGTPIVVTIVGLGLTAWRLSSIDVT